LKHAVELDTLDIVDRLNNLTHKAAALAAGILGFEGQEDAPGGLQDIALEGSTLTAPGANFPMKTSWP